MGRYEGVKGLVWLVALVVFCTVWGITAANISDSRAIQAAEDLGYTDVQIEDSTIWFTEIRGCGENDMKMWSVSGVNPRGERRTFIVCAGFFKGATVRSN